MRRASVATLLVALFALMGASATPMRVSAERHTASIVWQGRGTRKAPVARTLARPIVASTASSRHARSFACSNGWQTPASHALFQRPPPQI